MLVISPVIMAAICIHSVVKDRIVFRLTAEWYSSVYMYHIYFIQSTVDGLIPYLTFVGWAVVNMGMQILLIMLAFPLDIFP